MSEEIEGDTDRLGTEFRFHHKDLHRSTQKITEFVPGGKDVWHVVDGQINFVKDKTEWDGTEIVFGIAREGRSDGVALHAHRSRAHDRVLRRLLRRLGFYVSESLRSLITTGKEIPRGERKPHRAR